MKKLSVVLAVVVAAVLLIAGVVMGFDRGADVGGAYTFTAILNEKFEISDVEEIVNQAGAKGCVVQKYVNEINGTFKDAGAAFISFEADTAEEAVEIYNKTNDLLSEKYFLSYSEELTNRSSTLDKDAVISMWPAIIIAVIMIAYVFIRFGAKMGVCSIINMFTVGAATLGLVGVLGIKITGYTIPALMIGCALAYAFTVILALLLKGNLAKLDSKQEAISVSVKQNNSFVAVVSAIAAIGFAVVLIIGGAMLSNFAVTALIGIVINAAVTMLVMPGMLNGSKKA